jgi:16S rRNA pseudouridine516 synthase
LLSVHGEDMKLRRLDQLLSSLGYCSRKEATVLVREGRVLVSGVSPKNADSKVDAHAVTLDGSSLEAVDGLIAVFHKPLGYVCTHSDGEGPTIYDLLPQRWSNRNPAITSVGRLDKDTSGLLLVTDVGTVVHHYTSPKSEVEKVYLVAVDRDLDDSLISIFASGTLMLRGESKPCLPAQLEITGARNASLTLTEGRYHQVRRMFASQGWHVEKLHREKFGEHLLADLKPGEWRTIESSALTNHPPHQVSADRELA